MKTIQKCLFSASIVAAAMSVSAPAQAAPDAYTGEIFIVGFNFCPRGTTALDGQLQSINSNQALFSLVGTTFGGDGRTTFGIPGMRGRAPIHQGSGPGLTTRPLGQRGGTETNTMTIAQMPTHTHRGGIRTRGNETATSTTPRKNSFANAATNTFIDGISPTGKFMHADSISIENEGGGQAQNNMMPNLALKYCLQEFGVYPSRQ